jgi:hypothetical protein
MEHYKYPRTYHFDWSLGLQNDDRRLSDSTILESADEIITTIKMDGENTNLYSDLYHARSLDSNDHPSRHYVKGLWGSVKHLIPEGWRICGENVYAKHSIFYEDLDTYFYVFNIWDENNVCLKYDDTLEVCTELGLIHAPVIYRGKYDEAILKNLPNLPIMNGHEGYVVRNSGAFNFKDFEVNVAKYVRKNHVQTDQHWMLSKVVPNKLKK